MAAANSAADATRLVTVLGESRPIRVSGSRDARVNAIASCQRGRVSRRQLVAGGLSHDSVDRLAASGHLQREYRSVYAVGHTAPTPLAAETAALLACGPKAVLSHLSAARLWKIMRETTPATPIHITISGRHGPNPHGVRVHRTATLRRGDVLVLEGLAVTSPARTLVDAADLLARRELEWSVDEAIQLRLVTASELARVAAAAKGRRGAGALAAAAARHIGKGVSRSELEKRFRALIAAAGLPQPVSNVRLDGYQVDFYWPAQGLVVETDGYKFHRTRPKFEHDAAKGAALVAHGLQLMRFTWRQMEDAPFLTIAQLAQALVRAEASRAA